MVASGIVLGALKAVGGWVLANPQIVSDTVHMVADKKNSKERLEIVEEKLNQVGEAALELDQKIDAEVVSLRKEMRAMKIALITMGAVLGLSIVAIILLAFLR